jgi:cytochrome o ubiquinol oxidase subunit 3
MSHHEEAAKDRVVFGLWVYLMTDLIVFGALFATYAVLRNATAGGASGKELFSMPGALTETLILLASSFTSSLAMLAVNGKNAKKAMLWFGVTFLLGLAFLGLELKEFSAFIAEGNGPQRSAFLSSFFALVGTHGLHIATGLLWMVVSMVQIKVRGLTPFITSKLERLSLFWHFLDIVWIFIFTFVYLMSQTG